MKPFLGLILGLLFLVSCDRTDHQGEEWQKLEGQYTQILDAASKVACTDGSEWKIVGITPKPCGGYYHFLAYHKSVENDILPKVNQYNSDVNAFNKKWNKISDCAMAIQPKFVECVDGKAVMKY